MDDPVFVAINPEGVFVIDLDDVVGAQLHAFQIPNLSFKNQPKNYLVSVSGKLHHDYYSMYITITLQPMNAGFATNGSPRPRGSYIITRAHGLPNLGAPVSQTSTVTLRMIYFTTWEVLFTPGDSDVYMTINLVAL